MSVQALKTNSADIVIVGSGPLGWACARILSQKKIRTHIVDPHLKNQDKKFHFLSQGLGVFWPSLNDPPTRAFVAHGKTTAQWLQDHCQRGLNHIHQFFAPNQIQKINCSRIALLQHEREELDKACLLDLGIKESLSSSKIKIYQENVNGYFLNSLEERLFLLPEKKFLRQHCASVSSVTESKEHCIIELDNNEQITSEMVILANGHRIAQLAPWLSDMVVPMSDVYTEWKTNWSCLANAVPQAVRTSSGHVAALLLPVTTNAKDFFWTLRMTGPRFFLPSAGVGIDLSMHQVDAGMCEKIESWLRLELLPALQFLQKSNQSMFQPLPPEKMHLECVHSFFAVDCLPCDELPILGEVGHQGRVLASTGWLGCGWSASLQSAVILCELIERGRSEGLLPLLHPKRWRSGLNEDGVTGMT